MFTYFENRRARELCKSRGGRPGLSVSNSLYGLCGRKATLNLQTFIDAQQKDNSHMARCTSGGVYVPCIYSHAR